MRFETAAMVLKREGAGSEEHADTVDVAHELKSHAAFRWVAFMRTRGALVWIGRRRGVGIHDPPSPITAADPFRPGRSATVGVISILAGLAPKRSVGVDFLVLWSLIVSFRNSCALTGVRGPTETQEMPGPLSCGIIQMQSWRGDEVRARLLVVAVIVSCFANLPRVVFGKGPTGHAESESQGAGGSARDHSRLTSEAIDGACRARSGVDSAEPFWRVKTEWRKALDEERAVVVSVRTETVPGVEPMPRPTGSNSESNRESKHEAKPETRFTLKGAGLVATPRAFAFTTAQDYSKLKGVSSHFKTVEYNPQTRRLFLVTEALGWQARMILQMEPVRCDVRDELRWSVVWGDFKGMVGVIAFESRGPKRVETSIEALYQAETLPLPKVLMGFALEAIAQKVARDMRSHLEEQYRIGGKATSGGPAAGSTVSPPTSESASGPAQEKTKATGAQPRGSLSSK